MREPEYPSVPGQAVPNPGLATYGEATPTTAIYTNSDSTGPDMCEPPELIGADEIGRMGIDPGVPYQHLQLANDFQVETPAQLAAPPGIGKINTPTFYEPNTVVPGLIDGDLTGPGIDRPDPLGVDPYVGDLLDFARPGGLTILAATSNPLAIDPVTPDLSDYDRPAGLEVQEPLMPDPTLPDLREPDLTQSIHMQDRPGDLAGAALDELHHDPTYNQIPADSYRELWMQQRGVATHRERKQGMMMLGLDQEEQA